MVRDRNYLLQLTGLASNEIVTREEFFHRYEDQDDNNQYECIDIPPIPAKNSTLWAEGTFCGRRAGKSFMQVIRPDQETKKCPEET